MVLSKKQLINPCTSVAYFQSLQSLGTSLNSAGDIKNVSDSTFNAGRQNFKMVAKDTTSNSTVM
jgi:hypothetical protein